MREDTIIVLTIVIVTVVIFLWALYGPRNPNAKGPHVDLARQSRERAAARARGEDDDPTDDEH